MPSAHKKQQQAPQFHKAPPTFQKDSLQNSPKVNTFGLQPITIVSMDIETFRDYCLSKKAVEETFPFDETTLVFKVMGKMFALTGLDNEEFKVNLKCDPEYSVELREEYEDIQPGWHMNKFHWNTVYFENGLPDKMLLNLIDISYDLVVAKLKKADREFLKNL